MAFGVLFVGIGLFGIVGLCWTCCSAVLWGFGDRLRSFGVDDIVWTLPGCCELWFVRSCRGGLSR